MNYPKITVVTQCFNRAPYIAKTIESVLNQGYPNLEYIVLDDNSTDGSWEIIQKYRDRLAHCEQRTEESTTPVPSINYGFSKSTGEIMTWLNAKNVLMPKSLFTIADVFSTFPEIEWVSGLGCTIDESGKVIRVVPYRKGYYAYLSGERGNIQQESTFFKRSLWDRAGGMLKAEYPNAFDAGLWCANFFPNGGRLHFIDTIIGAYRKNSGGMNVIRRKEFDDRAEYARQVLRKSAPKRDLVYATLYRALRPFRPILRNIPDALWNRLPVLKQLGQDSLRYRHITDSGQGILEKYRRNPYRTLHTE